VVDTILRVPCPIRVITAGQVADAESMLAEEPARIVSPLPNPAVDPDMAITRQFNHPLPQLPQRDVHSSIETAGMELGRLPDIQEERLGSM